MCSLTSCSKRAESHGLTESLGPEVLAEALSTSEKLFAERADIAQLREAIATLARVRNPDRRNYEVEWKFAKYSYFLGKSEPIEKDAVAAFEKGRDAGKIAARVEPNKPDGHFWHGANLGELARISPVTVGIKSVDDIRETMMNVVAIEPGYQGASAYDALGQLEIATRNFKGGKTEKAVEYYEKGIELSPDNSNLRLHLAEAYLALKKDTDARKHLNALLAMKPNPEYVNEHETCVAQGRKLLERNF